MQRDADDQAIVNSRSATRQRSQKEHLDMAVASALFREGKLKF
jgi:hypothetical protein